MIASLGWLFAVRPVEIRDQFAIRRNRWKLARIVSQLHWRSTIDSDFPDAHVPERPDMKTTKRPSAEHTGYASKKLPSVSCFGLLPSLFMRQMFRLRERLD